MVAEAIKTSEWQAIDPYYKHLYHYWTKIAEFRLQLNNSSGTDKYYWMEQWYEFTLMWYDSIYYMLSIKEIEEVDNRFKVITDITNYTNFELAAITIEQSTQIKEVLSELHRFMWRFQGKYQILPKRVQKNTSVENW
jgi:hypothetical protein